MSNTTNWQKALAPYARPRLGWSLFDIATSVVPYLALYVGMYFALDVSLWIALALAIPAGGFLLRTFIVFHDCAHGSFLPSKRANRWFGRFCALLVWQPFSNWRHDHAVHHGTAGDLDRRGQGDVPTLTVEEYYARSWSGRLGYRLFRNPLVMFGLGPLWSLMIGPRLTSPEKRRGCETASCSPTSRSASSSGCRSGCSAGFRSCSCRCPARSSLRRRASGSSTSSTSSRTSTGRTRATGPMPRRACAEAPT